MERDANGHGHEAPTRRDYVKYGGAVIGGGLLAGCTGESDSGGGGSSNGIGSSSGSGANGSSASNNSTGGNDTTTSGAESYSVTMSPVGNVEFESVPTNVMAYSPQYADMLVALGHDGALNSLGFPEDYGKSLQYFFTHLDGVSFDASGLTQLYNNESFDKEILYELNSDVHLMDPAWATSFDNWSKKDTEEITNQVGPWFANRYSRQHTQPPRGWRNGYRYYTIWEITGKVAQVFKERARFDALKREYEKLRERVRSNLPPENERPTVGLVAFYDGTFSPYKINGPGFGKAHTRPMEAVDVFADSDRTYDENYEASYDFEGLLEFDPDVLLHNFAVTPFYDWSAVKKTVTNDPVGEKLTAVQNDRFYASGQSFQGPLQNLFQIEMTAKQLYPAQFGKWPRYEEGESYPDLSKNDQLFDHGRVADIVAGRVSK